MLHAAIGTTSQRSAVFARALRAAHQQLRTLITTRPGVACPAAILAAAIFSAAAPTAGAQCIDWYSMGSTTGVTTEAWSAHMFDADGSGPASPRVIVAGPFNTAGGNPSSRIASFDGSVWRALGSGLSGSLVAGPYAMTTFDPDADGPQSPLLIVGAEFTTAGGIPARNIAAWDGSAWHALGAGIDGHVYALAVFDPDADGPLPPSLYAGGVIYGAGSLQTRAIARWDGHDWFSVGGGINGTVTAMLPFDPDDSGPQPEKLIVGGVMLYAGTVRANGIAAWDGSEWSALGNGVSGTPISLVRSMTIFRQPGEPHDKLTVCGSFTTAGDTPADHVAQWDGAHWSAIGGTLGFDPVALAAIDFDREGDNPPTLYVAGNITEQGRLSRLVNNAWQAVSPAPSQNRINSIAAVDLGGINQAGPGICVTGAFQYINSVQVNGVALRDESAWWPWGGRGVTDVVFSMDQWDRDGDGPLLPELLVGGNFLTADNQPARRVASWNGSTWDVLGGTSGPNTDVRVVHAFDFDAEGPEPPSAVAGGYFTSVGTTTARYIARWTDSGWQPIGSGNGISSVVFSLHDFDLDADGPSLPSLIAGGIFGSADGSTVNSITHWNGTQWRPLGPGFLNVSGAATVYALTSHDPDGAGPEPLRLVAGGLFTRSGTTTINSVGWFDGAAWHSFGPGLNGQVRALASYDADGDGPGLPELYAGGDFTATSDGTTQLSYIARWDGQAWHPLAAGCNPSVLGLKARDPDGDGPLPEWLLVVGTFSRADGLPSARFAAWDGTRWIQSYPAASGPVFDVETFHPNQDPDTTATIVGGNFTIVDDVPSGYIARAQISSQPIIRSEPQDLSLDVGDDAAFSVEAAGEPPLSYRWTRDGADLADGTTGEGTIISGSATSTLRLTGIHLADASTYQARITNPCGTTLSRPAHLAVRCPADFDGNGNADFFDYLDFAAAFDAEDPRADLDGNGQVDFFDYLEFVAAFDAGC
jgi:hypothetical protein